MYSVSPFGERRQDLRNAYHTANVIASHTTEQMSKDDFTELFTALCDYLPCDKRIEDQVDLEALERMKKKCRA
jgi:hypothetical protein